MPQRNIQDNIVIAKEIIHTMKTMKGKKFFFAFNIDIEHAYNRVKWSCVDGVLKEFGYPNDVKTLLGLASLLLPLKFFGMLMFLRNFALLEELGKGMPFPLTFLFLLWKSSHT